MGKMTAGPIEMNCVRQSVLHATDTLLLIGIMCTDNHLFICYYNKLPLLLKNYKSYDANL